MKNYIKEFTKRGLMWGAWGGPAITAIVWMCLKFAGVIDVLTVNEAVLGIFSTIILGFIAAGVSIVYQIESIPKGFAGLIQGSVLYIDYIVIYLLNGWLPVNKVLMFTLIFVTIFALIWLCIYIPTRIKISRLNKMLNQ